jgi:ABC-type dipeptide/oligopeptide/nickel transport system permease component
MKRILSYVSAALVFFAVVFALTLPTSTASAADINERCNACLARTQSEYEQCQAQFGFDTRCDEQFNRNIVNCYRQFCEQ